MLTRLRVNPIERELRIQSRDSGWVLTLVVGGAALLVAVLALSIRLLSPSELAVISTESWSWSRDGVRVEPTTTRSAFESGDLVIAMDGRPLDAWVAGALPFGANSAVRLGPAVTFDVIRDGRPVRLDVALAPFPPERIGKAPLGPIVFGAGVLVLAVILLARRPRSTVLRLLFVGAAANVADISAWELGLQPTDFGTGSPFLLVFAAAPLFNMVFWSTIVHILAIYPVRSALAVRHRSFIPLIYIAPIVAVAVGAVIARLAGGTVLDWIARLANDVGIVASAMLVAVIAATISGYRRSSPGVRRSVRVVAITLVFAAVATLCLLTLPIAVAGRPLLARSTVDLVALTVPIALLIAVIRDRLFQVALLTRSRERVVAAREDERRKLRRDLHDELAPTLAAVGLKLDLARQIVRSDPEATERTIDEIRHEVRAAISDIRRLSRELRPPALDSLGLVGAVRQQADGLSAQRGDGPVMIVDAPEALPALPAAVEVAAYRIAVEGMMNAIRHAGAATCQVRITLADGELVVEVTDDGAGMTAFEGGVGTRSMLERAAEVGGDVRIEDAEPSGTRVRARLPVDLSHRERTLP